MPPPHQGLGLCLVVSEYDGARVSCRPCGEATSDRVSFLLPGACTEPDGPSLPSCSKSDRQYYIYNAKAKPHSGVRTTLPRGRQGTSLQSKPHGATKQSRAPGRAASSGSVRDRCAPFQAPRGAHPTVGKVWRLCFVKFCAKTPIPWRRPRDGTRRGLRM